MPTPATPRHRAGGSPSLLRSVGDHAATRQALLPLAVVLALVVPALLFVAANKSAPSSAGAAIALADRQAAASVTAERTKRVSRAAARPARRLAFTPRAVGRLYATAPLNVWTTGSRPRQVGLVPRGTHLRVTAVVQKHWRQVFVNGRLRWVNNDYLSKRKPGAAATSGVSAAPCPDGSGTEAGLTSNAVLLYRAVCAAFPALTSYGGYDGHGEHSSGRAIDFMTSDPGLGTAVANWVRANAGALHIYDVIWSQHIWTPVRGGEGWRAMPDRGSATANHYDHVHISVY